MKLENRLIAMGFVLILLLGTLSSGRKQRSEYTAPRQGD